MATRMGLQQRRWLVSVTLALCVDAVALSLAGVLVGAPASPVAGGAPARLLVSLGPATAMAGAPGRRPQAAPLREPGRLKAVAEQEPEPPVQAEVPAEVAAAGPPDSTVDFAGLLAEYGGDGGAGPGAAVGAGVGTGGQGDITGDGAAQAELLRRLEVLIRGNLAYPPLARKRNIQGEVRLSLLIGADGTLHKRSMVSGSGSSILDEAAIALIDRLFPLDVGHGLPSSTTIVVRIVYSLTS